MNKAVFSSLLLSLFLLIGHIIDARTQQPVSYATVMLVNKHTGTLTGLDGRFKLAVPTKTDQDTLTVTAPGYHHKAQFWKLDDTDTLTITLTEL